MVDQTTQSPLSMSDEDIMNMDPSQFEGVQLPPESENEESTHAESTADEGADAGEQDPAKETDEQPGKGGEEGDEGEDVKDDEDVSEQEDGQEDEGKKEPEADAKATEAKDDKPKTPAEETAPVDFEAEYKRLLAPFKANGRDVAVKSVDDAIALMQMGVNYNKKMAGLKPHLKLLKTLEKNDLLDENKISYLVDLTRKDPGAINKLVKDSGIDPMDLDAEKAEAYRPQVHTVHDHELLLDQVISEIKDSPAFSRTVQYVSDTLDAASKDEIAKYPQGIKLLNDHMESGIFDLIMSEVDSERLFGRLQGLSDLEAYRQVGDAIQARGGFDHLGRQGQQTPATPKVVVPNPKKEDDGKLREKRRAASPTKPGSPNAPKQDFNPLALSDDEFNKLANSTLL